MKDKKALILIVLAAIVIGVFLFLSRTTLRRGDSKKGEAGSAKLRKEIIQTRDMMQAFVRMNTFLNSNLNAKEQDLRKEKEKSHNLEIKLKELSLQNELLDKELISRKSESEKKIAALKEGLDSIDSQLPRLIKKYKDYQKQVQILEAQISQRDAQMQSLEQELKEGLKEEEEFIRIKSTLEKRLDKIEKEESILEEQLNEKDARIENLEDKLEEELIKEKELSESRLTLGKRINEFQKKNILLKKQLKQEQDKITQLRTEMEFRQENQLRTISSLEAIKQDLQDQLGLTKVDLERLNDDYANLKRKYESVRDDIAKSQTELAKRAERLLNFQDRLAVAEQKIEELENDSIKQKGESATLRRQYVLRQLENQTLKDQLNQHKQKLVDLQTQIFQATEANSILQDRLQGISGMFVPPASSGTDAKAKKVDVELIPKTSLEVSDEK